MNHPICFSSKEFNLKEKGIQKLYREYTNHSTEAFLLSDCCFLSLSLPAAFRSVDYYASSWGKEFTKEHHTITDTFSFVNSKGRCSAQSAPFFTLSSEDLHIDFAICTSGNYQVSFTFDHEKLSLLITDADTSFKTMINPGCSYTFPHILAHVWSDEGECYPVKQDYRLRNLTPHPVYQNLPVIYNHWWAYEDRHIDEETILSNARIAHEIGIELLVLDAGWFGNDSREEGWFSVRGDWNLVNQTRFPHGLAPLRARIEEIGLKLGIWCEIEGLGQNAALLKEHPEYAAVYGGENAGYVCFGSSKVQEWAYQTMHRLFEQCGASYWKLDFNLDPGYGCNSTEHNHGPSDGLAKHYEGLYRVLDRLRADFPNLVIENCSSGGQRLNLEMAEHTHIHFLSDPDYSTHQMRIFKEASKWLLPKELLHFMWSNTVSCDGNAPFENLNLNALSEEEIRYHMRLSMMHQFGISHRLTEYSKRTLSIMKKYLLEYKNLIRSFIANGTYQPVYLSKHCNIFSFSANGKILLFCFAEKPEIADYSISGIIDLHSSYSILDVDVNTCEQFSGTDLCEQTFTADRDWSSKLLLLSVC